MSVFKCKICGGDLDVNLGDKIVKCAYCGTSQTIPISRDEKILKLFARGNLLRTSGEFDKAYSIFEQIIAEGEPEAEAYWDLLLCKYGILYVDDYNGTRIPTINRLSMTSILEDPDFKKTIDLSVGTAQSTYLEQARTIAKIQNKIIKIVNNEKPYDIFISYKETDEFGDRTKDSVLAQDIYNTLTKEGYRVFLARISLSNVAGQEYEPYIYSALFSSKIMLLVASDLDYINSTWIKNEWQRFVSLLESHPEKKIIPCYQDVNPYDFPKELRNIQGLDSSKIGFIQDLVIGINKIFGKSVGTSTSTSFANTDSLLKRAKIMLEDGEVAKAKEILNTALNINPECAEAYGILLLIDHNTTLEALQEKPISLESDRNYQKILRYGNDEIINTYKSINEKYKKLKYLKAKKCFDNCQNNPIRNLKVAKELLKKIPDYSNSDLMIKVCDKKISELIAPLKKLPDTTYVLQSDLSKINVILSKYKIMIIGSTSTGAPYRFVVSYWNIKSITADGYNFTVSGYDEVSKKQSTIKMYVNSTVLPVFVS